MKRYIKSDVEPVYDPRPLYEKLGQDLEAAGFGVQYLDEEQRLIVDDSTEVWAEKLGNYFARDLSTNIEKEFRTFRELMNWLKG